MNRPKLLWIVAASALLLLSGCKRHASEQAYLARGKTYFDAGDFDKARVEFKNAARIAPTDGEPYYRLGLLDEKQGNIQNAFAEYMEAVQQSPHLDPALLKLASFYFMSGQTDQAAVRIAQALSDHPDDPNARAADAALKHHHNDDVDAEAELKAVLVSSPANVTARAVLAEIYADRKDGPKTAAVLDTGIAANPKDTSLLVLKVQIFDRFDDEAQVSSALLELIRRQPEDGTIREKAAQYFVAKGHADQAEHLLRDGIAAAPDDLDMKRMLVNFLDQTKGLDAAESEIHAFVKATPTEEAPNLWLADLYLRHNQTDRAVAQLNDVVARRGVEKPALTARTMLARIDLSSGNTAAAKSLVTSILQNDPDNQDAILMKASIEADSGDYQSAASDARSLLSQHPDSAPATRLLVQVLVKQGYMSLAIDTLHNFADQFPNDLDARIQLAQLYAANGDAPEAMTTLRDLTKAAPNFAKAWENLAEVAASSRDWKSMDDAVSHLETIKGQEQTAGLLRGEWLAATGNPTDALAKLTSVVQTGPTTPQADQAIPVIADLYRHQGQLDQGIAFVSGLDTKDPVALTVLGELYLSANRPEDASAQFDLAIAQGATIDRPYIYRAQELANAGKPAQAETLLRQALDKMPDNLNLLVILGDLEMRLGENQQAIALYRTLLAKHPDMLIAANNFGELVADFSNGDADALKTAEGALLKFDVSNKPVLMDTLGWVYFREGKLDLAASYLQQAAAAKDAPPQVHYHYGMALLSQGHLVDAKNQLQQATVSKAKYPGLDDARKALAGM